MFGMISRKTKESCVYCVLNARTKNNLLPILKKNIITCDEKDEDLNEKYSIKTRIYPDSFSSYQSNDFKNAGYILKLVNHSVGFGYGLFHTNIVENLWNRIKNYADNFSGISIKNLRMIMIL